MDFKSKTTRRGFLGGALKAVLAVSGIGILAANEQRRIGINNVRRVYRHVPVKTKLVLPDGALTEKEWDRFLKDLFKSPRQPMILYRGICVSETTMWKTRKILT